jgi:hypothetical protein
MNAPQEQPPSQAKQDRHIEVIRQNNQHHVLTVVRAALEDLMSARKWVELSAKHQAMKDTGQDSLPAHWTHHRSEAYQMQVQRSVGWIRGSLEEVLAAALVELQRQQREQQQWQRQQRETVKRQRGATR